MYCKIAKESIVKRKLVETLVIVATCMNLNMYPGTAGADQNIITKTYSCNGDGVTCNFSLNAVGDLFSPQQLAVGRTRKKNLGDIKSKQEIRLNVKPGSKHRYTLTTTKSFSRSRIDSSIVGKQMEIFALTKKIDKGLRVTFYRLLPGEKKYMEMGVTDLGVSSAELAVELYPNGNIKFTDEPGGSIKTITLGRVIPRVTQRAR